MMHEKSVRKIRKTTPQEKSWVEDGSSKKNEKVALRREKGESSHKLSSKRSKTTKKNSWVDKDLTKSHKKRCFEENGAV